MDGCFVLIEYNYTIYRPKDIIGTTYHNNGTLTYDFASKKKIIKKEGFLTYGKEMLVVWPFKDMTTETKCEFKERFAEFCLIPTLAIARVMIKRLRKRMTESKDSELLSYKIYNGMDEDEVYRKEVLSQLPYAS